MKKTEGEPEKDLQNELETLWKDPFKWNEGSDLDIGIEGMRAVELLPDFVVLRSVLPGMPENIRDVPVGIFLTGMTNQELIKFAEEIFRAVQKGDIKYTGPSNPSARL